MSTEKTKLFQAASKDVEFYTQVLIVICICGISVGIPFALYHIVWGQPVLALVLIPVIALQCLSVAYLLRTGYNLTIAVSITIVQTAGSSYFAIELGLVASYWLFASGVANYFIVDRRIALLINVIACITVAIFALQDPALTFRYGVSFAMINVFLFGFSRQLEIKNLMLDEMLTIDPLTRAGNRAALDDALRRVKSQNDRYRMPVTMIMIDLDHFKRVNDTHGHSEGDRVLQEIAKLIQKRLRDSDTLYRFGGEEFIIVTENTRLNQAAYLAEDIRRKIASHVTVQVTNSTAAVSGQDAAQPGHNLTVSMGVAQLRAEETTDHWLNRADMALYKAKSVGRNWVCFDAESAPERADDEVDDNDSDSIAAAAV